MEPNVKTHSNQWPATTSPLAFEGSISFILETKHKYMVTKITKSKNKTAIMNLMTCINKPKLPTSANVQWLSCFSNHKLLHT